MSMYINFQVHTVCFVNNLDVYKIIHMNIARLSIVISQRFSVKVEKVSRTSEFSIRGPFTGVR